MLVALDARFRGHDEGGVGTKCQIHTTSIALGGVGLLRGKAQFAADALVQVFGKGLGHLDREGVQIEVILGSVQIRGIMHLT